MVNEATICIRFAVDVIDGVKCVFETFVYSYAIAFAFVCLISQCNCLVYLSFLVNVTELIFSKWFSLTSLFLFGTAHKRDTISLSVLFTDLLVSRVNSSGDGLLARFGNAFVWALFYAYGPVFS